MWQGTWTNLYHNHAERKYVRFPCDRIGSLQNLWRGPCRSRSVFLCYGVHSASNREKIETRQTSVAVVIDEDVGLVARVIGEAKRRPKKYLPRSSFRV